MFKNLTSTVEVLNLCFKPPLKPVVSTRGTRATSGTRVLSKWHTQSHYINADSQEFTISWEYRPPSLFPALPDMVLLYLVSMQIRVDIHM